MESAASEEPSPRRRAVFLSHGVFATPAFGRNHPLSIPRHGALVDLCRALGTLTDADLVDCPIPDVATLARFHDAAYLTALEAAAASGRASEQVRKLYNLGTMECPLFPGLWDRARATVGGAIEASRRALAGELPFHPAGGTHHGRPDRASGFCYFNDPVFAILTLLDAGLSRVLYVDLDAHHGDGVEDAFAADPRVVTMSIHETGRWPGTGREDDRRDGRALNLPVPAGFNDAELHHLLAHALLPHARRFAPDAVVVVCGVDALAGDPLSHLSLSNVALCDAVEAMIAVAPRAVVLGGGGYNPWTLTRAWAGLWSRLSGRDPGNQLPSAARRLLEGFTCDLVDDDDRRPEWTATLWDPPNEAPVRDAIRRMADRASG